jgi:xanthine dehydrogenase small subunit
VAGATDLGVQHNHGKLAPTDVLTTGQIEELEQLEIDGDHLVIGAAVSWARIAEFVRDAAPEYYSLLLRFGSPQIRHAGTLAGNLANASPIADSIPFHYVAGSTIQTASIRGRRDVEIERFYLGYKQIDLAPDEIITSVCTPLPKLAVRLKLYKISKRRDMDISTVTAAFWIELADDEIQSARIAFGGVGPTVVRLPLTEARLRGQPFTAAAMRSAGQAARGEISPITDVRGSATYRLQLVENLFVKCYHDLSPIANSAQPLAR